MVAKSLGEMGIRAIEGRGLSVETAVRYGIYTGSCQQGGEFMPDPGGNVVAFPYFERDLVVAEKYRAPGKRFWQRKEGKKTFWNADALDDPGLIDERSNMALVICEGELDALTAIDCGYPLAVSVPDGAPPPNTKSDPAEDGAGTKFEFMWNNRERLSHIRRFILAVDNDAPGQKLAEELLRRLGPARCSFVTYPEGCKDLNDVLRQHGKEIVRAVLDRARPYPVHGLYEIDEYPADDPLESVSSGWSLLDPHFKVFPGSLTVLTGIPSHGKSQWAFNLLCNLAVDHGWRSAVFSPEMPVVPYIRKKLCSILHPHEAILKDRFKFIDVEPITVSQNFDVESEPGTLEWVLDRAAQAVMRFGVRVLLIDPWNELEQTRRRNEMVTDYVGRGLRMIKRFARLYRVAVIVVCHPTKEVYSGNKDGKIRTPSLYDCEGSAHWFNKCDHGIVIDRSENAATTTIHVAKSRFPEAGVRGSVVMKFEESTGRYLRLDGGARILSAEEEFLE